MRAFRAMYINKFQIQNYKSYWQPNEIALKPGFNIITGQNSAGKTALLEALTLQFSWAPHLSRATVPFRGAPPEDTSIAKITFVLEGRELVDLVRSGGNFQHLFPRPNTNVPLASG